MAPSEYLHNQVEKIINSAKLTICCCLIMSKAPYYNRSTDLTLKNEKV